MTGIRKYLLAILGFALLAGCRHKKKISLSGEEPVAVMDFIDFFHPVKLSYQLNDSIFQKDEDDSSFISYKVFTRFVPDSVLTKVFGKGQEPEIYSLGKAGVPKAETYLFAEAVTSEKKAIFILAFDKKNQFNAAMAGLRPDQDASIIQSVTMDRRHTITKSVLRKNADGTISEGKDVYVLNAALKKFMLIMTDAMGDKVTELINPIDTLPRKNKFSADYGSGKMNLVSIRDGLKSDRITFFVHFEKNNGNCTGELKGEAILHSANTAEYRVSGDPCILKFTFGPSSVTLKETDCGNRRGLQCLFDGGFQRKKDIRPKPVEKNRH